MSSELGDVSPGTARYARTPGVSVRFEHADRRRYGVYHLQIDLLGMVILRYEQGSLDRPSGTYTQWLLSDWREGWQRLVSDSLFWVCRGYTLVTANPSAAHQILCEALEGLSVPVVRSENALKAGGTEKMGEGR